MTVENVTSDTDSSSESGSVDALEIVQRVDRPLGEVWARLTQREGIEALLGEGATLGDKGDAWHASDGTYGVTRSYHPEQQVRVSWHADQDAPPTLVDLQMARDGEGTVLTLRHEHLTPQMDRDSLRERWDAALHRLTQA